MSESTPRRMGIGWLALPAGVALVMSGVVVGRTSARSTMTIVKQAAERTASSDSSDQRLASLEQEVAKLRADRLVLSRQDAPPPDGEARQRESARNDPAPEDDDRALEERRAEFLEGLDDRLATEPLDPRWRADTERSISTLLPQHMGPGIAVSEVSCGSSVCRAKVQHPGSAHLPDARLADFMLQRGPLADMQVNLDTRETGTTTLYFTREAQPVP